MPTFQDPISIGDAASESMRTLAHATRVFDDPAQTYDVLGDVIAVVRSLGQVLNQVASAHLDYRDRAFTDLGDSAAGAASADRAAEALRDAAQHLTSIDNDLDAASRHSGRIAWHPMVAPTNPGRTPGNKPLAARCESDRRFDGLPDETPRRGISF
ncbi:hypothetical protein E3T55_16235 [Cryobacterium frigoriphilum]|uniref:Uncharacterized protein n=1 Tax=Cryobacterium frigoriphilum TaxID=1259150 RepID=A0A4R8ZV66_9MICO|nr:hypothetical protein [Cryobacterium frigoriphilum]TFD46921.1 hypothetical protein E3T55_16235 [Cryobacterium frigoriphilum]